MTVGELIKALSEFDLNEEVEIGFYGEEGSMDVGGADVAELVDEERKSYFGGGTVHERFVRIGPRRPKHQP